MKITMQTNIQTFKTNDYLLNKAIEDLTDEDIQKQPTEQTNPIQFLLGHLTLYRYQICSLFGEKKEYPHEELYKMGAKVQDSPVYPSVEQLKKEWQAITEILMPLLENVTEEQMNEEIPGKYPVGDQNKLGAVSFMAYHESYHVGQIGYIRKFLGKGTLIG